MRHWDVPVGTVVFSPFRGEEASLLIEKGPPQDGKGDVPFIMTKWMCLLSGEVFTLCLNCKDHFPDSFKVVLPSKRVDPEG